jgi:membrane protease subunit HflC
MDQLRSLACVSSHSLHYFSPQSPAQPIGDPITNPGLHVKVPFAQDVNVFDKRWLEWTGNPNQVPTRDKKYIWVETYARWRISNPLLFFQRLRDERGAQSRLDDIIDGDSRNVIASHNLIEAVRESTRVFERADDVEDVMETEATRQAELGRHAITRLILERASKVMPDYGIELVDIQIHRINYIESVQAKVFERMISERKRIAERSRSEGQGKAAEIRGQKERDMLAASSVGYKNAQGLKGAADAKATAIYSKAYGRDPEFYQFLKAMETLNGSFSEGTTVILSTDSELLKYLKGDGGR